MRLLTAVPAGVLTTVAVVAGAVTPAHAATTGTVGVSCQVEDNHTIYRASLSADYSDNEVTGLRTWTMFRFIVRGGSPYENSNNVNFTLKEYGSPVFDYNSPDSIEYNRTYAVRPENPVHTDHGRDHRTNSLLALEGIFDQHYEFPQIPPGRGDDPSCEQFIRTQ